MQNHQPVLVKQLINLLKPKRGETFVDMTAGYGGHSEELLKKVTSDGRGYLIDRDSDAVKFLKKKFEDCSNVEVYFARYSEVGTLIAEPVDMCLLDLGVSSAQLDQTGRGFSFNKEARLDMRMDKSQSLDAHYVVNSYSKDKLAEIFKEYGEERQARRIASSIVESRRVKTIESTLDLAKIIYKSKKKRGKIDSATKTFQAIRIEVNDELNELSKGLQASIELLKPSGRLAVISFHSLEDRMVKQFINDRSREITDITGKLIRHKIFNKVTKKPISGGIEDSLNRRARSAKLRVAVKIK